MFVHEELGIARSLVKAERDKHKPGVVRVAVVDLEIRYFGDAGGAPGRPEVEQDELALKVGELEVLAIQRLGGKVRGGLRPIQVVRRHVGGLQDTEIQGRIGRVVVHSERIGEFAEETAPATRVARRRLVDGNAEGVIAWPKIYGLESAVLENFDADRYRPLLPCSLGDNLGFTDHPWGSFGNFEPAPDTAPAAADLQVVGLAGFDIEGRQGNEPWSSGVLRRHEVNNAMDCLRATGIQDGAADRLARLRRNVKERAVPSGEKRSDSSGR